MILACYFIIVAVASVLFTVPDALPNVRNNRMVVANKEIVGF